MNLSHEIRTPLTIIKGNLNQLLTTLKLVSQQEQGSTILRNSNKIQELIDEIIDLAKMNNHKLELRKKAIDPVDFLRKLVASFSGLYIQKSISISMNDKTIDKLLLVDIDGVYLERSFSNLLLNAYKYTTDGGAVTITLNADNNSLFIEIADTGCGIAEDDLPYIFDNFYQAKNNVNQAGGSGVGLSFAREVIRLHDGDVSVDSTEDMGSSFHIVLPLSKEVDEVIEQVTMPAKFNSSFIPKKRNLLIVEDNVDMRSYLTSILSEFNIVEAGHGQEALQILATFKPDIIITDYMMPVMDGLTFIQNVKEIGLDCPVIVLTARTDEEGKMDFLRLGIDDYLTKPFNEEELKIRIKHSIRNSNNRTQFIESENSNDSTTEELDPISAIIQDNIRSEVFGVPELAKALSLKERTLYRRIKAITGLTPNGLIRELKLLEAQKIASTQKINSVTDLAKMLGFKNGNYFSKLYKERFGKDLNL